MHKHHNAGQKTIDVMTQGRHCHNTSVEVLKGIKQLGSRHLLEPSFALNKDVEGWRSIPAANLLLLIEGYQVMHQNKAKAVDISLSTQSMPIFHSYSMITDQTEQNQFIY